MKLEQEIIDMENFYATATLEEAIAYFKSKSAQCFTTIKTALKKAIKIIGSIMARFSKIKSTAHMLKADLSIKKVYSNQLHGQDTPLYVTDQIDMESCICNALEILTTK